jgi:DNA-binding MarR family transcriptional regulator
MTNINYVETVQKLWLNSITFTNDLDKCLGAIHGLGFSEYMVLHNLTKSPKEMMRRVDIASELGRTASGITRLLIPMEKMGLVSKESSERDARVSLVKVTNSGKKIFNDATVTMNERCQRLLQNLDHGDVDRLLGQMNKIRGLN